MSAQLEVCRVCEADTDLEIIFQSNQDIAGKLMICADVKIDFDDDLPKYICFKCHRNLNFVYEFKVKCEYTDRKLREYLATHTKSLENEEIEMEENNEKSHLFIVESDEGVAEYLLDDYADVEELIEESEDIANINEIPEGEIITSDNNEEITALTETGYNSEQNDSIKEIVSIEKQAIVNVQSPSFCLRKILPLNYENHNSAVEDCTLMVCENSNTVLNDFMNTAAPDDGNEDIENKRVEKLNEWKNDNDDDDDDDDDGNEEKRQNETTSKKFFTCDTCGESFKTSGDFNFHIKSHGDHRYQCLVCMKWFPKRFRLKNHMAIHEAPKYFSCDICGNKYTNQGNRDRHIRHFHKQEKPYMCTQCGLSFTRSNILKLHYTVHMKERNYECEICKKRFKAEFYLNLHKKSHIPIEERRPRVQKVKNPSTQKQTLIICSYCGKKSFSRALHLSHIRVHTGEKPFECKTCGKKFAFRQSLKSHKLLHTGEKPYHCDLCGLTFRQIGHLKGHMLIHSGVKKHKCQYCDKAFSLKSNLVVHQRLHTGEKPYSCNYCNKTFCDSNGLKRHEHSHQAKKIRVSTREELTIITGESVQESLEQIGINENFIKMAEAE